MICKNNCFRFILILSLLSLIVVNPLLAKKNPNLDIARELIREKKFTEAMDILLKELTEDEENEDEIMKLIDIINRDKTRQINDIDNILTKIKSGDTENVQELIENIDTDIVDQDLVTELEKQRIIFEKKNNFENFVYAAEEDVVLGTLRSAYDKYRLAFEVYRADSEAIQNPQFKRILRDFTRLERDLERAELGTKLNQNDIQENIGFLTAAESTMKQYASRWQDREDDFYDLYDDLETLPYDVKKVKEYEYKAIQSIIEKYILLLRRSTENYARSISSAYMDLIEKTVTQLEEGQDVNSLLSTMLSRVENLEQFTNYRLTANFSSNLLAIRSTDDLVYNLDYISRINSFRTRRGLALTNRIYIESRDNYKSFQALKEQRKLYEARSILSSALTNRDTLRNDSSELVQSLQSFSAVRDSALYSRLFAATDTLTQSINALIENMDAGNNEIQSLIFRAERLQNEADTTYRQFRRTFDRKQFETAKTELELAKQQYVELSSLLDTKDLRNRLSEIFEFSEEIDKRIFEIELAQANSLIDEAKFSYYDESYEEAKQNLDAADVIYKRYELPSETIDNWRTRILTAIRIKSGSEITPDDPAYYEINELFVNARKLLDKKDYQGAGQVISLILNEKPYNRDARFLETLVLNNSDPEIAQRRYDSYFTRARTAFESGRYGDALQEFNQLLQFGKDQGTIKNYIARCRRALGLDRATLTNEQKRQAQASLELSQKSYASNDMNEALRHINNALRYWDSVPGGRDMLIAIQKRTGKYTEVKLTYENTVRESEANKAYAEGDYERCYQLTLEILRTQDVDRIRRLNKKADLKRKS